MQKVEKDLETNDIIPKETERFEESRFKLFDNL